MRWLSLSVKLPKVSSHFQCTTQRLTAESQSSSRASTASGLSKCGRGGCFVHVSCNASCLKPATIRTRTSSSSRTIDNREGCAPDPEIYVDIGHRGRDALRAIREFVWTCRAGGAEARPLPRSGNPWGHRRRRGSASLPCRKIAR